MQQQTQNKQQELVQINTRSTYTQLAKTKNRIMSKYGITENEWNIYDAELSVGLLKLRIAFPTQTRNYSAKEHDMLMALWFEMFVGVEKGMLNDAIMRFIRSDRQGYFPSPGQIIGIIANMQAENEQKEKQERYENHIAELRQRQQRIDNGENCSTCQFCEHRDVTSKRDSDKTEAKLFCKNPNSYQYDGKYGDAYGTSATILCEHYEKNIAV